MKRFICVLAALIILSALPGVALGASPDWTLVQIPAPKSDIPPAYVEISGSLNDITVDVNNNLYVMSDSKITRFTSDGQIDRTWGDNGSIYDEELKALNSEQLGIAADSRGYVYAHCRICEDGSPTFIKRYAPDGKADIEWYGDGIMGGKFSGEDFIEDAAETAGGVRGGDEIALDGKDNLYVLHDRQVYRFLPDGKPDKKWRKVKMKQPQAVYDDGGDGVWFSNAMRIDHKNNVYLFNGYDRILSKFSRTGRLLKKYRCPLYHSYEDEFGETSYLINQVAFDAKGNMYNINKDGNSISRYSPKIKPDADWCKGAFTAGNDSEPVQKITDFDMDAAGNLYILDEENGVVSKYTNDGSLDKGWGINGSVGSVNGDGKIMPGITDIVCDIDGSMYANTGYLKDGNAIIYKVNPDFTLDVSWGADVSGSFKGHKTDASVSMAAYDGNLYIETGTADVGARYNGLIKLDGKGIKDAEWSITPGGPVWDIQTDDSGNIYVAGPDMVSRYLPDGNIDENWSDNGVAGNARFIGEMAADGSGYLYVSDRGENCIVRYTPEGHLDRGWGESGRADIPGAAEDSAAYYTYFIVVDSAGSLYLSDYINNRILRYNKEGRLDASWCGGGEWKSDGRMMIRPTHLIIYDGRLYAVWNNKLYVMNDSIAGVGVNQPQASAQAEPEAEETVSTAETLTAWQWALCVGALLFCAGAVIAMILLLPKKKNKRRRLTKIKSIKIAKR